jgi:hypothetical protein
MLVSEASKANTLFSFFDDVLATSAQRLHSIDLVLLDLPRLTLSELGGQCIEHEICRSSRSCRQTRHRVRMASPPISYSVLGRSSSRISWRRSMRSGTSTHEISMRSMARSWCFCRSRWTQWLSRITVQSP